MTVITRRDALIRGFRYLGGSALGLGFFDWLLENAQESLIFRQILERLALNDLSGAAYAADSQAPFTLVQIVLIDKVQASLFQVVPGNQPAGSDGQDGAAQKSSEFRSMNFTKLFGDGLMNLPETTAVVMLNAWESGNAGHSLQNSVLSDGLGGLNSAYEKLTGGSGLLGPVGFSFRSAANDSGDVFVGPGSKRMQVFNSVSGMANTLKNSINPLLGKDQNRALLKEFDKLVVKNTSFRDSLMNLATKVQSAIPDLETAGGVTDPIDQQVQAIKALSKAGVGKNFMLAVPYADTNAGGTLVTRGGSLNLDPFSATPSIAKALVDLHQAIPDLVCISTSDGGRSLDNGDQSAGVAFLTGPTRIIKNGVIGPKFTNSNQLGRNFGDVALSSGTKQVARPRNWYATALKAMGMTADVEHVPEALQAT